MKVFVHCASMLVDQLPVLYMYTWHRAIHTMVAIHHVWWPYTLGIVLYTPWWPWCAPATKRWLAMAGWLHGVFVGAREWLFVFPLCGFSLSLFCNYPQPMDGHSISLQPN